MCKRNVCLLLLLALGTWVYAQELANDDTLRGAFIRERPSPQPPVNPAPTTRKKTNEKLRKSTKLPAPLNSVFAPEDAVAARPLAVGYSVYKRGSRGRSPRLVGPATIFRKGDAIRFTVEPNSDGYFYIFTQENDGALKMLFPSSRLKHGENFLHAHHLYEVPSSQEQDPNNQWFIFDNKPAQEHFYFVLSRDRIAEIPSDAALQQFDEQSAGKEWTPPQRLWEAMMAKMSIPLLTDQRVAERREMHPDEVESITRGVGLKPKSPAPTVLKQQKKAKGEWLVIKVTVTHQ